MKYRNLRNLCPHIYVGPRKINGEIILPAPRRPAYHGVSDLRRSLEGVKSDGGGRWGRKQDLLAHCFRKVTNEEEVIEGKRLFTRLFSRVSIEWRTSTPLLPWFCLYFLCIATSYPPLINVDGSLVFPSQWMQDKRVDKWKNLMHWRLSARKLWIIAHFRLSLPGICTTQDCFRFTLFLPPLSILFRSRGKMMMRQKRMF